MTGATGRVGYQLLEALADARAEATALVRVEARAADLPGRPNHLVGSLEEPPPAEVLRQFDRIFLLSPEIEEQAAVETVFIDAVVAAGHQPHIVKVCPDGFQDPDCDVRFMRAHRQVALHLDAVGLPVTYLAAATYMDDLLDEAEEIRRTGEIRVPAGDGRAGFVAAADVALAAAGVLTTDGHEGAAYVLTGPEALGYADVAARFAAVFAWQVDYVDLPADQARDLLRARGLDPWEADGAIERYDWIRQGGASTVTPTVADLIGTGPRPLHEWLSESRATFARPA
ncbi:MAG TPA: NmrA family NAD(P)-binding protein [Trebonia sp.]|nr:NmrA family NAD(P)-binding protein [Trebonia sp.]